MAATSRASPPCARRCSTANPGAARSSTTTARRRSASSYDESTWWRNTRCGRTESQPGITTDVCSSDSVAAVRPGHSHLRACGPGWHGCVPASSARARFGQEDVALREPNWSKQTLQVANSFASISSSCRFCSTVLTILGEYVTHLAGVAFVVLAWIFVISSACAHAYVHVTSNNVRLRGPLLRCRRARPDLVMWSDLHRRGVDAALKGAQAMPLDYCHPTAPRTKKSGCRIGTCPSLMMDRALDAICTAGQEIRPRA